MMRVVATSCSWCHAMVPIEAAFCACGHEAHKPRMLCRCERCVTNPPAFVLPTDLADALARAEHASLLELIDDTLKGKVKH